MRNRCSNPREVIDLLRDAYTIDVLVDVRSDVVVNELSRVMIVVVSDIDVDLLSGMDAIVLSAVMNALDFALPSS